MEKLLVSGCLLGHPCRYDGKAKRNEAVCALREKWELISVCPETMVIAELLTLEDPYHCPHGRPTIISLSKRELEKKLKRIV